MFINLGGNLETEKVVFEIYLGNQLIQSQVVTAPEEMLKMMFLNYIQQLAVQKQPMHLRMRGEDIIWDNFENRQKVLPKYIDYWNYNYEGEV